MNFHPILFSTEMVQAIMAGRKTMTRRILKPQPHTEDEPGLVPHILGNEEDHGKWYWDTEEGERILKFCPYGYPGHVLWVRESFCWMDASPNNYAYKSDFPTSPVSWNWKPSIHMPKIACRIFLQIKSIKVERLQAITEADAVAEGIFFKDYGRTCYHNGMNGDINNCPVEEKHHPQKRGWSYKETSSTDQCLATAKSAFGNLWLKINGEENWSANPFVWVIEFERIEKPKNFNS